MNSRFSSYRRSLLLAGSALAAYVATPQVAVAQGSRPIWRLATGYADSTFQTENVRQFASGLEEYVGVTVSSNNTLVKLADIFEAVRSGRIEAGEVILSGIAKAVPLAGADSVPFVVNGHEDARRLWQHQRAPLERQLAEQGVRLLYAVPWPGQGLYTRAGVSTVKDFKGVRMRTFDATTIRIAEFLGATGVDVPFAKVREALAGGQIDSMITSSVTGVSNQVWDHLKFFYRLNAWLPKNAVIVNMQRFAALDAGAQRRVLTEASRAESRGWAMSAQADADAQVELSRKGMKVDSVPPELRREFQRLGERFSLEWIRSAGRGANEIFVPYYSRA